MNDFIERIQKLSPKRLVLLAAELQAQLQKAAPPSTAPVAIIGLGLRLPGGATDPDTFWAFLCRGGDAIREVPASRWAIDDLYDPDPDAPGKMATRWGGFVDDVDQFDPQFFGITPREAASMDPQQRILLEVCWETLERGGYAPDRLSGSPTGVFVGACNGDYYQLLLDAGQEQMDMYLATGNAHSVLSGRISYLLGLQGPSLTLDTACSSSLVAVHLATQSLRNGECRMALAGGVNAILSPDTTIALSKAKMMAPDGRCKAFAAAADGFVRAEGCGMVLLKRLADAEADGDNILAVIRGAAVNQDGRSNGLTAPNGPAQVAVIRQALAAADLTPDAVSYVETHGTGTSLGDPIEVRALAAALGKDRASERPLMLGSVKTNLGHLESAAGVAGLIKLILALHHRYIPPHLHLHEPNPYIPWDELPVVVPTAGVEWEPINGRWLGGVSSFGFSGTNAHLILEAAPARPAKPANESSPVDRPLHLLRLAARSADSLQEQARRLVRLIDEQPATGLADMAFTANVGRADFAHRLTLTAATTAEVQAQLSTYLQDATTPAVVTGVAPGNRKPEIAFLFSGHGGQAVDMGRQLYATQPVFREAMEQCDALLRTWLPESLLGVLYPASGTSSPLLEGMTYTQPALFAIEYALAQVWRAWGIEPGAVVGHSLGEYAAACVAGVLRLEDGIKLVAARARLMDAIREEGAMYAVFADEAEVSQVIAPFAAQVAIAALNGPQATVISGAVAAVEQVVEALKGAKIRARRLAVAQGAHSPLIDTVLDEFTAVAQSVTFQEPRLPLISSLYGQPVGAGTMTNATYWRRHLREPVRFAAAMQSLRDLGYDAFVEIGPSPLLLPMGQRCLPDHPALWTPSLRPGQDDWQQLLESLGLLYTHGAPVDWVAFDQPYARRRIPLPTSPFERQRYWFTRSPQKAPRHSAVTNGAHPLLGRQVRSPALQATVFETELSQAWPAFLADHRIFDVVILPSPAYLEMALQAAAQIDPSATPVIENFTIHAPLILPAEESRTVQLVVSPPSAGRRAGFQVLSLEAASATWKLHAAGDLRFAATPVVDNEPEAFSPTPLQTHCPEELDGPAYYRQIQALGLDFGPSFRGIHHLWRRDGEALGHMQLPTALAGEAAVYAFHPAFLDACFHLLGAPLPDSGREHAYLLIGIERLQLFRRPAADLWNHTMITTEKDGNGETFTGDIHLYDQAGQLVAAVEGLQLKRANRTALQRAVRRRPDDWTYAVQWQPQPAPQTPTPMPNSAPALVFADADGVGAQLVQLLRARGEPYILVVPGASCVQQGPQHWQIDPADPAHYRALLDGIGKQPLGRIFYLWGINAICLREHPPTAAALEGAILRANGGLLRLVQALCQATNAASAALWVATRHAQAVTPDDSTLAITQAPLWGFGRVIALEHPELWGGLVDLDTDEPRHAAQQLLLASATTTTEDQVAWRNGERYVARLVRSTAPSPHKTPLQRDATYLVTGGLGGLGLQVAHWMAERGAGQLVLLGRRGLPPRGQWADLAPDDPVLATVQAVQAIEALGTPVTVVAADISDRAAMTAFFAAFGNDLPPLRGIIHAAADLSNKRIAELDQSTLEAMLRPKVAGAWLLHELSMACTLDFFVLFSSTTALWGSAQLAHYAAANHFMDAFAHYRRSLGLPALSINWGTWSVMRAASAAEQRRVHRFGLEQMPAEQALDFLGDLLHTPAVAQVTIAAVDWPRLKAIYEARRPRPFLTAIGADQPTAPPVPAPATKTPLLLEDYLAARPAERNIIVIDHVRQAVATVMGAAPAATIDPQLGFFEMGLDSLMSVELKSRLEALVEHTLPSTLTFNYPTINEVAGYLEEQILAPAITVARESVAPPTTVPPVAIGDAAPPAAIDDLSEDELAALLSQQLSRIA